MATLKVGLKPPKLKPFIKIGHRFGAVFVRMVVPDKRLGRTSYVLRFDPQTAAKLAVEISACAVAASRRPAKPKLKIMRRKQP